MASISTYALCILLLGVTSAFGLVCYQCDSSESSLCNYGIFSLFYSTVDCKQSDGSALDAFNKLLPQQCVKITAKTKDGSEYVGRGCAPYSGGACNVVVKTLSFFSSLEGTIEDMNCATCSEDKCNSAIRLDRGLSLFGLMLVAIAFLF